MSSRWKLRHSLLALLLVACTDLDPAPPATVEPSHASARAPEGAL